MPKRRDKIDQNLNVSRVLEEFHEYENSHEHRKGTFKLDVSFEQAIKKIAKAKPGFKTRKKEVSRATKRSHAYEDSSSSGKNR